ncbi:MAG: hypothetical protein ACLU3I_22720 [Acutalibacteraceae bacterium]
MQEPRASSFYDRNRTGQLMSRLTTDLFEITELAHHGPEDLFISLGHHRRRAGRHVHDRDGGWPWSCAVMIPVFLVDHHARRRAR